MGHFSADPRRGKASGDRVCRRLDSNAKAAECPTIVGNGNEEACRQPVHRADLTAEQRHFPSEAHRADAQLVRIFHHVFFQLGAVRGSRIHIVYVRGTAAASRSSIAAGSVTADADPDEACAAALPLGLIDSMHDAFTNSVEVAVSACRDARRFCGRRVLDILVLTAAALQDQQDFDIIPRPFRSVLWQLGPRLKQNSCRCNC